MLRSAFGDRSSAYQAHNHQNAMLLKVVSAMAVLFPDEPPVTITGINNYFSHARSRNRGTHQIGKVCNNWCWLYFQPEMQHVISLYSNQLKALLSVWTPDDIAAIQLAVLTATQKAVERQKHLKPTTQTSTNTEPVTIKFVKDIWPQAQSLNIQDWRMTPPNGNTVQFCLYMPGNGAHAIREVTVAEDLTWQGCHTCRSKNQ